MIFSFSPVEFSGKSSRLQEIKILGILPLSLLTMPHATFPGASSLSLSLNVFVGSVVVVSLAHSTFIIIIPSSAK
jgi:hypothetical protein